MNGPVVLQKRMALADGFLGGKASCGSANCVTRSGQVYVCTDIPALTRNRKAHFTLTRKTVSRVWYFGSGIGESEKECYSNGGLQFEDVSVFRKARLRLASLQLAQRNRC